MSSLISSLDKGNLSAVFDSLHDTFSKPIYVYTENKEGVTVDENTYNPVFGDSNTSLISNDIVLVKTLIYARVMYENKQVEDNLAGGVTNVPISRGHLRLKISKNDWALVKNSVRIEIDEELFILDSDPKNQGPFISNYKMIYVKRE